MEFTDQIEEVLDGLENPTADELLLATSPYTKRDVLAVLTRKALASSRGEISGPGSVDNPVAESVVNIVASETNPIALSITGPPVGAEDDYHVVVVTGAPDLTPVFFLWKGGGITVSPADPAETALDLVSSAEDGTPVLRAAGALGEVVVASADGTFSLNQPGVGPVLRVNSDGQFAFGAAEPGATPSVPASPDIQDVVDALVARGLITQEA